MVGRINAAFDQAGAGVPAGPAGWHHRYLRRTLHPAAVDGPGRHSRGTLAIRPDAGRLSARHDVQGSIIMLARYCFRGLSIPEHQRCLPFIGVLLPNRTAKLRNDAVAKRAS